MRNLTITRNKTFVGAACHDKVYIRDAQSSEITIEGVPCRKIGELKNGETKTFQISEEEQQLFLIVDVLSKERCNASVMIPAGVEDVAFSGKHHFVLGSNPFRFDGVELTAEQLAKQKKNNRKSLVTFIAACIVGLIVGFGVGKLLLSAEADPKVFTKNDFQITLTEDFQEDPQPGFYTCYTSDTIIVSVSQEDKELFDDITLDEYQALVLQNISIHHGKSRTKDGVTWIEYTSADSGQDSYYFVVCYESEDAFWIINFVTPSDNQDNYENTFLKWAKEVKVN